MPPPPPSLPLHISFATDAPTYTHTYKMTRTHPHTHAQPSALWPGPLWRLLVALPPCLLPPAVPLLLRAETCVCACQPVGWCLGLGRASACHVVICGSPWRLIWDVCCVQLVEGLRGKWWRGLSGLHAPHNPGFVSGVYQGWLGYSGVLLVSP
jgi:hypothetical protein